MSRAPTHRCRQVVFIHTWSFTQIWLYVWPVIHRSIFILLFMIFVQMVLSLRLIDFNNIVLKLIFWQIITSFLIWLSSYFYKSYYTVRFWLVERVDLKPCYKLYFLWSNSITSSNKNALAWQSTCFAFLLSFIFFISTLSRQNTIRLILRYCPQIAFQKLCLANRC